MHLKVACANTYVNDNRINTAGSEDTNCNVLSGLFPGSCNLKHFCLKEVCLALLII